MGRPFIFAALLLAVGCSRGTRALPPIRSSDEVRVMKGGREVARIADPDAVAKVVALVNHYPDGWGVPWYGPPVAEMTATFYSSGQVVGDFGIGDSFVTRTYGEFYSRRADSKELAAMRSALNRRP